MAKLKFIRNNIPKKRMDIIRGEKDKEKRNALYKALWEEVGLTEEGMELFQQQERKNYAYLTGQSALCQKLVAKTFERIFKYATRKTGRPRFKTSKGFNLPSLEAKELHSGIIVKPDTVSFNGNDYILRWDLDDPYHVEAKKQVENYHAFQALKKEQAYREALNEAKALVRLENPEAEPRALGKLTRAAAKKVREAARATIGPCAKFGRFVFKRSKSGTKARLQIMCTGIAPMSHAMASTAIPLTSNGLDLGPTLIAHANKPATVVDTVDLTCEARLALDKVIGRLQRKFQRTKKGGANRAELGNHIGFLQRKAVEVQKQEHAKLHLQILRGGALLRKEDHGIKFLQRNRHYSRRISRNRPGEFLAGLAYKAAKAGGTMTDIDSRKARLSQVCIFTDQPVKKLLCQRYHELPNGVRVQRDHYSAWESNFADPVTGLLDREQARGLWGSLGVEARLVEAWRLAEANLKRKQGRGCDAAHLASRLSTLGRPQADRALSSTSQGCRQPCDRGLRAAAGSPQQGREAEGLPAASTMPLPPPLQGRVPETGASTAGNGAGPEETPDKRQLGGGCFMRSSESQSRRNARRPSPKEPVKTPGPPSDGTRREVLEPSRRSSGFQVPTTSTPLTMPPEEGVKL